MATDYECAIGLLAESTRQRHAMMDELTTLRTHLADAVAFVRKAGHLPGCERRKHCAVCNAPPFAFTHSTNRADSHPYKESPCTCGHDRIVGSEGE